MQNLENLLERAKNDEQAFREIYDFTIDRVFNYVLLRVKNREETKETVQEIYLSFWKSLPKFRYISEEHFYGFFWTVVKRKIFKSRLRKRETVSLEEIYDLSAKADIPEDETPKEDYRHLLETVSELKERQRLVVELRYFANNSFGQIAEILGVSESNAKVLHHRALITLRKNLHGYE